MMITWQHEIISEQRRGVLHQQTEQWRLVQQAIGLHRPVQKPALVLVWLGQRLVALGCRLQAGQMSPKPITACG